MGFKKEYDSYRENLKVGDLVQVRDIYSSINGRVGRIVKFDAGDPPSHVRLDISNVGLPLCILFKPDEVDIHNYEYGIERGFRPIVGFNYSDGKITYSLGYLDKAGVFRVTEINSFGLDRFEKKE